MGRRLKEGVGRCIGCGEGMEGDGKGHGVYRGNMI